jgi:hypothetical protein
VLGGLGTFEENERFSGADAVHRTPSLSDGAPNVKDLRMPQPQARCQDTSKAAVVLAVVMMVE